MSLQLPCLSSYTPYCSNQVKAKALLDQKKQDRRVQDFLQRCLQSPFSRKLDLWNFLDIPRSRLVKYPLLLREILKHTPNDHADQQHLDEAVRKTNIKMLSPEGQGRWLPTKSHGLPETMSFCLVRTRFSSPLLHYAYSWGNVQSL